MMEANIKEMCDFKVMFGAYEYKIDFAWLLSDRTPVWYDGYTHKDGVCFYRIFTPEEICDAVKVQIFNPRKDGGE
jgi:hypothetical protein